jgi:rare lipoprotein A
MCQLLLTVIGGYILNEPKMKMKNFLILFFLILGSYWAKANNPDKDKLVIQKGACSFYGLKFHNRKTASGEVYNFRDLTAAHKNLPFGTLLRVTNLKNNRYTIVKVNDRLPQNSKRVIDVSKAAALELDMIRQGVVQVRIEVLNDLDVLSLLEYFQDQKPEDLRLRYYERPLSIVKPTFSFPYLSFPKIPAPYL